MSESSLETYSALVDGEVTPAQAAKLIEAVARDPALRAQWASYHLIRDALRDNLPAQYPGDLLGRVRSAMAAEPVVVGAPLRRRTLLARPVAGLALAASVAAVALVGLRMTGPDGIDEARPTTQRAMAASPPLVSARWNVQQREVEERLNAYLVNHSEYLGHGMRGMLPYARIVSYDTTYATK